MSERKRKELFQERLTGPDGKAFALQQIALAEEVATAAIQRALLKEHLRLRQLRGRGSDGTAKGLRRYRGSE